MSIWRRVVPGRLAAVLLLATTWVATEPASSAPQAAPVAPAEAKAADGAGKASVPTESKFTPRVEALPYPPDAQAIEFDATFDGVEFLSGSSLRSLVAFYRREMAALGWQEDAAAAESDDESAELTFAHDKAEVVIALDFQSDGVAVEFECEGLDFGQTSDPARLVAAGVPVPRSYLFLQQQVGRPPAIKDLAYGDDECTFKTSLPLQAAFDFYRQALAKQGWRESRRPIVTADRRYTEYQRDNIEMSVNVFTHEAGSRVLLGYENETPEPKIAPLPDIGDVVASKGAADSREAVEAKPVERTTVDVARNKGSATLANDGQTYAFAHVAAYRTQADDDATTRLVFSQQPIPMQRLQELVASQRDFDFYDLYPTSAPGHLSLDVGGSISFRLNVGGTVLGDSITDPVSDLKVENGRIRGTVSMRAPQKFFDETFLLKATVDAGVITPTTAIGPTGAR